MHGILVVPPPTSMQTSNANSTKSFRPNSVEKIRQRRRPAPFRLLDLPPELRNRIYEYVFECSTTGVISAGPGLWSFIHVDKSGNKIFKLPPILDVSRQIRSETLALFHDCTSWLVCLGEVPALLMGLGSEQLAMASKINVVMYIPTDAVTYAHSSHMRQKKLDHWAFDGIQDFKEELRKRDLTVEDGVLRIEVRGIDEKVVWIWDWSKGKRSLVFQLEA